jgi:hypothetical protein
MAGTTAGGGGIARMREGNDEKLFTLQVLSYAFPSNYPVKTK